MSMSSGPNLWENEVRQPGDPTKVAPMDGSSGTTSDGSSAPAQVADPGSYVLPDDLQPYRDPNQVRLLQQILTGAGFNPGPIDGIWGPRTQAALNAWQSANNLPLTPVYDQTAAAQVSRALSFISMSSSPATQPGASVPTATAAPAAGTLSGGMPTASVSVQPGQIKGTGPNGTITDADIEREFGAFAWYLKIPELANVIRQAVKDGITSPDALMGRITRTSWWQNTSASVRDWQQFVHTNGGMESATVQEALATRADEIATQAKQLGVNMTPQRARELAEESLKFRWTPKEQRDSVLRDFQWKPTMLVDTVTGRPAFIGPDGEVGYADNSGNNPNAKSWVMPDGRTSWYIPGDRQANAAQMQPGSSASAQGQAGNFVSRFKQLASQYLVPLSDATLEKWVKDALAGTVDEEMFRGYLVEQAKSMFPGLSTALDRGITVRQYVEPYLQTAARELEISPDQIDLMDPKWSKPLFQVGKDGDRTQMSLADWQTELRSNRIYKWHETKAARDQGYQFSDALLQEFGAIAR